MSFPIFKSNQKGVRVPTTVASAYQAFPTDGTVALTMNMLRIENTDPTNGVYFHTGADPAAGGRNADNTDMYIAPNTVRDVQKGDSDTGIVTIAAAGTPALVVHFGVVK
jgi:hypothetical protein